MSPEWVAVPRPQTTGDCNLPFSAMAHKHLAGPVVQPEVASEMVKLKERDRWTATYLVDTLHSPSAAVP